MKAKGGRIKRERRGTTTLKKKKGNNTKGKKEK